MDKEKMQDIKERLDLFPSNMNEPAQKAYCELFDYINHLEQQCKKQKEVIDKIEEKIKENIKNAKYEITRLTITDREYYKYIDDMLNDLLQILEDKEV